MKGFRLISLEYGKDEEKQLYEFSTSAELSYKIPFTTLLIGPNGTGKSRLLRILTDIFNDLYWFYDRSEDNMWTEKFAVRHPYILSYYYNGKVYKFIKTGWSGLAYEINGKPADYTKMILPKKLITIAYGISDKFPSVTTDIFSLVRSRYQNNFYNYLGIKVHRSSATPSAHVYRMFDLMTNGAIHEESFKRNAVEVFEFLKLHPRLILEYKVGLSSRSREFLNGDLTVDIFKELVNRMVRRYSLGYSESTFQKLINDDTGLLQDFIKYLNSLSKFIGQEKKLDFDFTKRKVITKKSEDEYQLLNLARKLQIVAYRNISISKDGENYFSFKDSSSGQSQILTSMLSLASVIEDDSLILIDEPETSLHPNWQIKYFELLKKVFSEYCNSHFLVASHSHFLVSDLRPDSSSLMTLTYDDDFNSIPHMLNYSTYGWSAENILYNVFNVATVRNHYFEMDIRKLLKLISSGSKNMKQIQSYIDKLQKFKMGENDPLKLVLKDANRYIDEQK